MLVLAHSFRNSLDYKNSNAPTTLYNMASTPIQVVFCVFLKLVILCLGLLWLNSFSYCLSCLQTASACSAVGRVNQRWVSWFSPSCCHMVDCHWHKGIAVCRHGLLCSIWNSVKIKQWMFRLTPQASHHRSHGKEIRKGTINFSCCLLKLLLQHFNCFLDFWGGQFC